MATDGKITLNFVHPTESEKILQAAVGLTATPNYLIQQLIGSGFMEKPGPSTQYKLVHVETKSELPPNITLADAKVADNAHLNVIHSVSGARG